MPAWRRWLNHAQNGRSRHGSRRYLPDSRVPGLQVPARQAVSLRRDLGAGRRELLDLFEPRHDLHAGALREGAAAAQGRDSLPGRVPHRQRLVDDRLRSGLREHRVRLPPGRPVRTRRKGTASTPPRSCSIPMPGPSAAAMSGRVQPDWNDVYQHRGAAGLRRLRLGRRPPAGNADGRPGDLRDARAQLHPASVVRRQVPGHLRRHPREDPLSEGAGRQLPRADADLRVRRVRERQGPPRHRRAALQLLGLQHGRLLCAQGRLRGDRQARHAGGRVQGAGQGAAPQRHRGHPGRGLQPHGRRQRAGPVHLLPGHRQQDLLHADARGLLLQLQRHRQHAELQQPGRAQHGAGLPALLGVRVSHRRLPLRPGLDPGPRPVGRAAVQPAAAGVAGLRPDPGQVQADRRGLGRGRAVPGRLLPGLRPLGRVERQVPRRRAQIPEG